MGSVSTPPNTANPFLSSNSRFDLSNSARRTMLNQALPRVSGAWPGATADVARRQSDGTWLWMMDRPNVLAYPVTQHDQLPGFEYQLQRRKVLRHRVHGVREVVVTHSSLTPKREDHLTTRSIGDHPHRL